MQNVAPSNSLVRRANQVKTIALLVAAVGIFVTAVGILLSVIPLVSVTAPEYDTYTFISSLALVSGIALLILAAALAIRAFTWKTDNDLAMNTGKFLAQYLDNRFTLIRNVSKRQIGYVDAVLVGPPGVLVFRILDAEGDLVNDGANWLRRTATGELVPASINPTRDAIDDIRKVREYLEKKHIPDGPDYRVVVLTKPEPTLTLSVREPTVPPTHIHTLVNNLRGNYLAKDRIDTATAAQVVRVLFGG